VTLHNAPDDVEAKNAAVIPPKRRRTVQREYDRHLYAACRLKQCCAIATRYGKTARNFLAALHLVASAIPLN